jgi:hypothetical protein
MTGIEGRRPTSVRIVPATLLSASRLERQHGINLCFCGKPVFGPVLNSGLT